VTSRLVQQLSLLAPQLFRPGPPVSQLGGTTGPPLLDEPDVLPSPEPELLPEPPPEEEEAPSRVPESLFAFAPPEPPQPPATATSAPSPRSSRRKRPSATDDPALSAAERVRHDDVVAKDSVVQARLLLAIHALEQVVQ